MTELAEVFLLLVTFVMGGITTILFLRRNDERAAVIATGYAEGEPVSLRHRWFVLLQDLVGSGFGNALVMPGFGFGLYLAADHVYGQRTPTLCYYLAFVCLCGGVLTFVFRSSIGSGNPSFRDRFRSTKARGTRFSQRSTEVTCATGAPRSTVSAGGFALNWSSIKESPATRAAGRA